MHQTMISRLSRTALFAAGALLCVPAATFGQAEPAAVKSKKKPPAATAKNKAPGGAKSQNKPAKAPAGKPVADQGRFELTITYEGETQTFDAPGKAATQLSRIVLRSRRDEDPDFRAEFQLNGSRFVFTEAKDAHTANRAVIAALSRLRKVRAGLGDLGEIVPADPPPTKTKAAPRSKRPSPVAVQRELRKRVQAALTEELRKTRRPILPLRRQQIIAEQIKKAREEGLLPTPGPIGGATGGPPIGADRRTTEIESARTTLEQAFAPSTTAGEKPDADANTKEGGAEQGPG